MRSVHGYHGERGEFRGEGGREREGGGGESRNEGQDDGRARWKLHGVQKRRLSWNCLGENMYS